MRLATLLDGPRPFVAVVRDARFLRLAPPGPAFESVRSIAAAGTRGVARLRDWADRQPASAFRPLAGVAFAPAVAGPGAIYTIGLNYADPAAAAAPPGPAVERPLVYAKLPTSVTGHGAVLRWDRALTANVDAECELAEVLGAGTDVFGYTIVNDVSSRDPWLDGDQWLLGKSMPGFCPVGPWVVTADELDPGDLRLGCTINGEAIQDGRTSWMRFSIPMVLDYLGRHVTLRPGDLVATGTPARLASPPGPGRRLLAGDTVTAWIEGIGELTTTIA